MKIVCVTVGLLINVCTNSLIYAQPSELVSISIPKREWTNKNGQKFVAPVIRVDREHLVFWLDGEEAPIDFNQLAGTDRTFVQQWLTSNHPSKAKNAKPTKGVIRMLVVRANFADRTIKLNDDIWGNRADALFAFADPYYQEQSYGTVTSIDHDVTPIFQFDTSWATFKGKEGELAKAMKKRASENGWDLTEYHHIVLSHPSIDGPYGALGTPGTIWMPGDNPWPPGFAHELGHAFGVGHANAWEGGAQSWPGTHMEGVDANFTMGSGPVGTPWNLPMKYRVAWVPRENILVIRPNTTWTYRLFQFDTDALTPQRTIGLRAFVADQDCWISYAPDHANWKEHGVSPDAFTNGLFVHTLKGAITRVVDATPGTIADPNPDPSRPTMQSFWDTKDAMLQVGRTLKISQRNTHPEAELVVKPIAIGATDGVKWIDVQVKLSVGTHDGSAFSQESFEWDSSIFDQSSGIGWNGNWQANDSLGQAKLIRNGLRYPGLKSSGGLLQLNASDMDKDLFVLSRKMKRKIGNPGSVIWISYLLQPQDRRMGVAVIQLGDNPEFLFGKLWGTTFGIYIKYSTISAMNNQTHLLVSKFVFGEGDTDALLWVNPGLSQEPQATDAASEQKALFRPTETLKIKLQGYGHGSYLLDEIRVGPTFQSVTPRITLTN